MTPSEAVEIRRLRASLAATTKLSAAVMRGLMWKGILPGDDSVKILSELQREVLDEELRELWRNEQKETERLRDRLARAPADRPRPNTSGEENDA